MGYRDGQLPAQLVAFLMYLLDTAEGKTGRPIRGRSRATMAAELGVSERSIKRWCDALKALGWVAWCHNCHRSASGLVRQRPNTYVLLVPGWVQAELDRIGAKAREAQPPPAAPPRPARDHADRAKVNVADWETGLAAAQKRAADATLPNLDQIDWSAMPPGMTPAQYILAQAERSPP